MSDAAKIALLRAALELAFEALRKLLERNAPGDTDQKLHALQTAPMPEIVSALKRCAECSE